MGQASERHSSVSSSSTKLRRRREGLSWTEDSQGMKVREISARRWRTERMICGVRFIKQSIGSMGSSVFMQYSPIKDQAAENRFLKCTFGSIVFMQYNPSCWKPISDRTLDFLDLLYNWVSFTSMENFMKRTKNKCTANRSKQTLTIEGIYNEINGICL